MKDVSKVSLEFRTIKTCDIATSRKIIVDCIETWNDMINSDEEIRPYLHQYPFPADKVEIGISFYEKNGNRPSESVAYAFTLKGKIYYCRHNPEIPDLEDIWEEDYAEALKLVK